LPIGNFATVFSTGYWQLVFGKIFVGIGTGTCFIGGVRYLASYFSGERLQVLQGDYGGWLTGGNYRLSFTALEIFSLALALPVSGFRCYESRRLAEPGGENVEKWLALTARWEFGRLFGNGNRSLVEGESAGGIAKQGRDRVFLAVSRAWRPSRQESRWGAIHWM